MLKKHYILVLALLCLFCSSFGQSKELINQLLSTDNEAKSQALAQLIDEKRVKSFPIISAINDKKLYQYQGLLITLGEKVETTELYGYKLIQLYPSIKPILDEKGKEVIKNNSELEEISFSRAERLMILPVLPYINLVSLDLEKRKLAFVQFQQKGTFDDIKILTEAKNEEKDPYMVRIAIETILAIQLNHTQKEEEAKPIVDELVENKGDNTEYILGKYLTTLSEGTDLYNYVLNEQNELKDRANTLVIIQNLFSGLSLGSILIMIALGLSIIYGLAGVINMAHGEFMMIGAYTAFCVQQLFDATSVGAAGNFSFFLSIPLAFLVAGMFGLVIEKLILRKLYNRPLESLLATWGISLIFIQSARSIFGDLTSVRTPSFLSGGWEIVPQLILPYNRLFIIVMTILLVFSIYSFLYKSKNGLRIRSVTQNRSMSACLGISTEKIDALTFFIGSGIAGIAGCCITLIGNVVPDMGQTYVVDSFLVVVTGGVGNLFGSVVAGLGIGQLTKLLEPVFQAVYGKVIILVFIILFLQFKPRGLFPAKGRIAED